MVDLFEDMVDLFEETTLITFGFFKLPLNIFKAYHLFSSIHHGP